MSFRPLHPPCPFDVFELASAIAERGSPEDADTRALASFGFSCWDALAGAHAERITVALNRLPAPCDAAGTRLLRGTHKLIASSIWTQCISAGWPLVDLFGCHEWAPLEHRDLLGLVPAAAISPKVGRKLDDVTAAGAVFRDPDGRESTFRRPSLTADLADVVPWWQSPVLINSEAA